jgi:hypothetical protein
MRSIHFTLWFLMAVGACALRAQTPTPAPAIKIKKLYVVRHPDRLEVKVSFDKLLDRNHPEDLADPTNVTILAKPSGSHLVPVDSANIANTGADVVEMRLPLPAAKGDDSINVCFGVLHFLKGDQTYTSPKDEQVCPDSPSEIMTQAEAGDLADKLNAAAAKAAAAKTSSEKNIFASGFVTTAGQTGSQGGGDVSLNDFVPGLSGTHTFLQVQKTSVANGDPRHFEAGLNWAHVSSFQPGVDTEIQNAVDKYNGGVTKAELKTFGEDINKAEAKYNPVWLGALENIALKIEGDPTQFKAANAVGDGDVRILTRTIPLFGSKKGYFRARPLVVGFEGGRSIGQGDATTTTTATTTSTTTPNVNWLARAKVGADFTLFYDNSKAKSSPIKRVEITAGGVERYLFFKEINYDPTTKKDSTTGKGSRPYFQSDVKVFFAEDDKARYGLRMAYTRGSLPPVFANVKSFQFGFVVETKDEPKPAVSNAKTAASPAK